MNLPGYFDCITILKFVSYVYTAFDEFFLVVVHLMQLVASDV